MSMRARPFLRRLFLAVGLAASVADAISAAESASAALRVYLAPLSVLVSEAQDGSRPLRPERDLLARLDATILSGAVTFRLSDASTKPPATFLDAARLCEAAEYPYLLYGYLKSSEGRYYAEVKLLSREGKNIAQSFVAADDTAHYERLLDDLCSKIVAYFTVDLAIASVERIDTAQRNLFEFPCALGYWTPVGDWLSVAMGIVRAEAGARFIPKRPLGAVYSRPFYAAAGLRAAYALGKNQSGYETAFLHSVELRLPLELFYELNSRDRIGAALAALVSFDILSQERKYGDVYTETTQAGGLSLSLSYRRALSPRIDIGLECRAEVLFYAPPLWRITPMVTANFALPGSGGDSTGGRHE